MSKLFGDLSDKTHNKPKPGTPRMTCTRLRRFRETRQDLIAASEFGPSNALTQTENEADELNKKGSFAEWVERNQQARQEVMEKQNQYHEEVKNSNNRDADKTQQAFAHFSSAALQELARNVNTPLITLKWLAAHYDVKVRQALATNENIGSDILHILVRDGDDGVKEAVLDNKNITKEEILRLCDEDNPVIAEKAKDMLGQEKAKPKFNRRRAMAVTANIDITTARSIREKRK
jgi:hypothetical protein